MRNMLVAFLLVFQINSFAKSAVDEHLFVISGVVVNSGASKKIENFVQMIENKSGYKLKPFYVDSYARLSETLHNNPESIAWTCGAPFVEDSIYDKQQLVAVPLFNGVPKYSSFIIARKDDKRKKLIDFKNSTFAYSDRRSNSGYLAPSILLKNSGFDIIDFFRVKVLAGTHERSIESVYKGLADVAAIDEYVWVEYLKAKPYLLKALHVIEKTGPFPFTPIVAGSSVNKEVLQKIQDSLVNMSQAELKTFKTDFNMDGFVRKEKSFYDPIKKMLEQVSK